LRAENRVLIDRNARGLVAHSKTLCPRNAGVSNNRDRHTGYPELSHQIGNASFEIREALVPRRAPVVELMRTSDQNSANARRANSQKRPP